MFKKKYQTYIWIGILLFSTIIIFLTIFRYTGYKANTSNNDVNVSEFKNISDLSEKELLDIADKKRDEVEDTLKGFKMFTLSSISDDYNENDDKELIGISDLFLDSLKDLFTDELYSKYTSDMIKVNIKDNIELKYDDKILSEVNEVYAIKKQIINEIFGNSAVAIDNVSSKDIKLETASNNEINGKVIIKFCDLDNHCNEGSFSYSLKKVDNQWKVSKIN